MKQRKYKKRLVNEPNYGIETIRFAPWNSYEMFHTVQFSLFIYKFVHLRYLDKPAQLSVTAGLSWGRY